MDKNLKEVIKEVGKEYEMEDDIINGITQKLHNEFYIKLKHMKNVTLEIWRSLSLPINLYYLLMDLYHAALLEQRKSTIKPLSIKNPPNSLKDIQPPSQNNNRPPDNQKKIITNNHNDKMQFPLKNIENLMNLMNSPVPKASIELDETKEQSNLSNVFHNDLSILFSEIDNLDQSRLIFKQL